MNSMYEERDKEPSVPVAVPRHRGLVRANQARQAAYDAKVLAAVHAIRDEQVKRIEELGKDDPGGVWFGDPAPRLAAARVRVPSVRAIREHFGQGHGGDQSRRIREALARLGRAGALKEGGDDCTTAPARS